MRNCKNCNVEILDGNLLECPNCLATVCSSCAKDTYKICPYCYSDLEFMG